MYTNPSVSGATNGIIHGYDWYPVDGSIQDWTYWICGDLHITVELRGYPKTPPFSSLDTLWEHNYDAHLAAIEVCLNHGVNGLVADSISGSPLGASVAIDDPDVEIHSDSINGYYHRILLPGDYNLTFSKSGYHSKTLSVTVPDTGLAILNAELAPLGRGDLNGHVWLGDETDYSGVNIIAVSPSASAETTITDVSGYYEFTGLIPASDYIITASKLGFQDSSQTLDIAEYGSYTVDFTLYPLNYIYFSDFETDDGGLHTPDLGDSQDWEWGTPISGPSSSHSGTKLWGTLLDSDYNNSSKSRLILEDIDLPAGTSSQLTLSFWQWYSFQPPTSSGWPSYVNSWHDGGNIKLWLSTTDSLILHPNPDYDTTMSEWNQLIPEQRAYADQENGNFWHKVQIDLDDWAGNTVDISWDFGSSLSNVEAGWFIDDVAIYYTDYTAVEIDNSGTLPEATSIIISPNPFNNGCKIRVRNIRDSKLPLEIYSIRGKLIKSVEISKKDEYTTWNGEDLAGNSVASGIYLVRYGDKVLGRAIFIK